MNRKTANKSGAKRSDLPTDRVGLLDFLWKAQNEHGYIRTEDIEAAADALGISTIDVQGVVTFYHFLSLRPRGRFTIYLNNSPVSESKGFERVKEAFEKAFSGEGPAVVNVKIGHSDFRKGAISV